MLVTCSYQDLANGARLPFPFQPEWVIEALGMAEYNPADNYRVVPVRNTYELINEVNYQGQRVQKVTVFSRGRKMQVTDHLLRDARGGLICQAHIDDVANVGGVFVPKKITLHYPVEKLTIALKLFSNPRDVTINQPIDAEQSRALFTRPGLHRRANGRPRRGKRRLQPGPACGRVYTATLTINISLGSKNHGSWGP